MSSFRTFWRRLFHGTQHRGRRATAPPRLESWEDRTLLNSRFVVPAALANNTTTFATLSAAVGASGLASGDSIQIEPGSSPGDLGTGSSALLPPAFSHLSIQGDPAVSRSAIPQFTVSAPFSLSGTQVGFTLFNLNITLVDTANFAFTGNATLLDSSLTDSCNSANGITLFVQG